MTASPLRFIQRLIGTALAGILAVLAACGGGGGVQLAGGVGSGGTGLAEGVITGFGSVIIEGVRYDDSKASTVQDTEGGRELAEARLGQRARVLIDESGLATRIQLLPQLRAVVERVYGGGTEFAILGQRVRIVVAGTAALMPTQWSQGYSQVSAGDPIEVHGSWTRDQMGNSVLMASRIDRLDAAPGVVLLTAPVRERQADRLVLDDATSTQIRPDGVPISLKAGSLLSVWISRDALSQPQPWPVLRGRDASALGLDNDDQTPSFIEIYALSDGNAQNLRLQGVPVTERPHADTPEAGSLTKLRLVRRDGGWVPESITPLAGGPARPHIELKGVLSWDSSGTLLNLRGQSVRYSDAVLDKDCRNPRSGTEIFVEVEAYAGRPGEPLEATQIKCFTDLPYRQLREAQATLLSITTDTVSVRLADGSTTDLQRAFNSLLPRAYESLVGRRVEIEYLQQAGTQAVLRKLKEVRE
jgi:hypothetical protein